MSLFLLEMVSSVANKHHYKMEVFETGFRVASELEMHLVIPWHSLTEIKGEK